MNRLTISTLLVSIFTMAFLGSAIAKESAPSQTESKGAEAVEALSAYPKGIRQAIFEITLHPKLVKGVVKIQERASTGFKKLVAGYSKDVQKDLYQLGRFPRLLNEITAGGKKTAKQIKKLVKRYPPEIHKIAVKLGTEDFSLLVKIQGLNNEANQEFRVLLKDFPAKVKEAFLKILQHPEILLIMGKYPHLVEEAFQAGKKSPEHGMKKAGVIMDKAKAGNAKALKNYSDKTTQHQRALAALQKADAQFTQERNRGFDEVLDPRKAVQVDVNFNPYYYPYLGGYGIGLYDYPYWFGYPGWGFDGYNWDTWY